MKILRTYYPDQSLTQEEWMKEFKVASRVPKYYNNRTKEIMDMWRDEDRGSLFQRTIARIKVASPKQCPYLQ